MKGFRKKPLNSNSSTFTFIAQLNESDVKKALLNLLLDMLQYCTPSAEGDIMVDGLSLKQYQNYFAKCFKNLPNAEQLAKWATALSVRKSFLIYEPEQEEYVLSRELLKSKAGRTSGKYLILYSHIQDPPQTGMSQAAEEVRDLIEQTRTRHK